MEHHCLYILQMGFQIHVLCHVPEDRNLHSHHSDNPKSHKLIEH
jgi:hypothetical protein